MFRIQDGLEMVILTNRVGVLDSRNFSAGERNVNLWLIILQNFYFFKFFFDFIK